MATRKTKKNVWQLTPEEQMLQDKKSQLEAIEKFTLPFISEPTRAFHIGEEVQLGNLKRAIIDDAFYDGKVYGLKCTKINSNYGDPYDTECYMVEPWYNIHPQNRKLNETHFAKGQDIRLSFYNKTIESLIHTYHSFGIDMDPEYQRGYVWTEADKQYLLESVFANADIGKFVLANRSEWKPGLPMYEIVDGKQRLITLVDFFEGRLSYQGYFFEDIGPKDRNAFLNHLISYAEIKDASHEDILRYFLFLNRGGKQMDVKHLEKVEQALKKVMRHDKES